MSTKANVLWKYFHKGEKQNSAHYATYCLGCLNNAKESLREDYEERVRDADEATRFNEEQKWFDDACQAVPSVRGDKHAFIAHLIGSKANKECEHASEEAKSEARAQRHAERDTASKKAPRTTQTK
ncbi:hypothetical protein BT96DRAFT_998469 [Gymnopus androsaceus JB14]|uniref:Uncharacterized protein n=1 Tax=Gymnopus androsaceus JB14 TaxID=1447944 RepID=A0A6A4HBH5_9AGAR|nr:hypothetical protein BT96DRAFT_1005849 [Gymnopus androsaceus JB14]KAE9394455.1 hypothetical protein BT96DRAFT_998469 [Gymnopus androsaceus JB14]